MLKLEKRQIRRILLILLALVLCVCYLLPWAKTLQVGSATTSLSITFEGAGNGLDPQGNLFDINEIKNKKIIEDAIKTAGLKGKVTTEDIQKQLYVLPQAQADTLKQLLTLTSINGKTQDIGEQMVYPTTFVIGLKDNGIPSYFTERKLLKAITLSYKDYLKSRYLGDVISEPAYTKAEILDLDYPEMMKVLMQEAESLERYIGVYATNEPEFVSEKTGLSFADLSEKAEVLKTTDIGNLRSIVSHYCLTKDPENRTKYEQTLLKRAGVVAAKYGGSKMTAAEVVAMYDNNSNFVFASGDTGAVDLAPLENQFFSDLMNALVSKQTAYIAAKYDEQDIALAIEKLGVIETTTSEYQRTTKVILSGTKEALSEIEALKKTARTMAEEYYLSNIGSKINVGGISYQLNSYGNPVLLYFALLAIILLGRMIVLHLYDSEYGVYLKRFDKLFRGRKKNEQQ